MFDTKRKQTGVSGKANLFVICSGNSKFVAFG